MKIPIANAVGIFFLLVGYWRSRWRRAGVAAAVRGCWRWVRVAARARQLYDVGVGC